MTEYELNAITRQRSRPVDEEQTVGDLTEQLQREGRNASPYQNLAAKFWARFTGKGRQKVGWIKSIKNMVLSSRECGHYDRPADQK
jgi:hypothetical protein